MVCLGNICRSPLAQGILMSKITSEEISVDSAGTSGYHQGHLPDPRSIAIAQEFDLDITNQRSRKFVVSDFDIFDVIYAMDESNLANILDLARNAEDEVKVKLILNELDTSSNKNVPDPYYGGDGGFLNVYKMLDEACTVIAAKL